MLVLGIETSCDETGVALVDGEEVRSNLINRQIELHARFGGVVPEIASRAHLTTLNPAIAQALAEGGAKLRDLDAVAVTRGPGLAGALLVGVSAAKALALALDVPLIGVNHLEGHVEAAFLAEPGLEPPLVALIVSGGHTMIAHMRDHFRYEVMGRTIDDAAGEAFDKIARFVGLPFPGGPEIDRLAKDGNPAAIAFPRPLSGEPGYDVSMSGLKTAVIRWIRETEARGETIDLADLAASFQEAVVDVPVEKTMRAAAATGVETIVVAGGVAANSRLRARLAEEAGRAGLRLVAPPISLCTDNGAMIAAAGIRRLEAGERTPLDAGPDPNWSLG